MTGALLLAARRRQGGGITPPLPDPVLPYAMPTQAPYKAPMYAITPTPDGTGSVVHPDVVDFASITPTGLWRGHRYWMAVTPYYLQNDVLENPCILVSEDGYEWTEPAGITNPVYPYPGTGWQSDTDLSYDPDTDELVMVWRHGFQPRVARSSDGVTWPASPVVWDWPGVTSEQLSPALVRISPTLWYAYTIENTGSGNARILHRWAASAPEGPWTGPEVCTGDYVGNTALWHLDVIRGADDIYRGLMNEMGANIITAASSTDGLHWTRNPDAIITSQGGGWDSAVMYRGCMSEHQNGTHYRVWYSGTPGGKTTTTSWRIGYTEIPKSAWPAPPA